MALSLSIILEIIFTAQLVSQIRHKRRISIIFSAFLISFAHLVLLFNILNLISKMNNQVMILFLQSLSIVTLIFIGKKRKVIIRDNFSKIRVHNLISRTSSFKIITIIVFLIVFAGMLLNMVLIFVVPPNNNDAMSIHVARTVEWFQRGTFFPWETSRIWQLTFPLNAEILYFWTIVFTGSVKYLGYIPFMAGILCAVVISALFFEVSKNKWLSIFIGLIWLTFPVIQLNLTSTRHDHVSTALLLICFAYLYYGFKDHDRNALLFSGLAMGLALGTNFAVAMYVPGFGLLVLYLLIKKEMNMHSFLQWMGAIILSFLVFSSPIFLSNLYNFGSILPTNADKMIFSTNGNQYTLLNHIFINCSRWLYQILDPTGLPLPFFNFFLKAKAKLTLLLINILNADNFVGGYATYANHQFNLKTVYLIQEDEAWFGFLGGMIIFPWLIYSFIGGIIKKKFFPISVGLFFITSLVTTAIMRNGWAPYYGRYFIPLSALSMLTIVGWFRGKKGIFVQTLIGFIAISTLLITISGNPAKPVIGEATIWDMDYIHKLTLQTGQTKNMLSFAEKSLPEEAFLAFSAQKGFVYEYGLYGQSLNRTIFQVYPRDMICDSSWMKERQIEYILVEISETYPGCIFIDYHKIDNELNWELYKKK